MSDIAVSTAPAAVKAPASTTSQRLMSVDALRGFDMFWIIGADALVYALKRMNENSVTSFLGNQLTHADWIGFRFYDLIFPLFIFLAGVSTVFSLTKTIEQHGRSAALKRVFIRGIFLFVIGLLYSGGFRNQWPDMRLMGVINRIAIAYFFTGLIFIYFKPRAMVAIASGILIGYWAMMTFLPFPDVRPVPGGEQIIDKEAGFTDISKINMESTVKISGSFVKGVNLANYIDQKYLPGKKYDGTWDPEGILSSIPAIATCLLGVFAGLLLRSRNFCDKWKVIYLISFGAGAVLLGFLWGLQFPVIKKIWTSSFVLVAGGYSAILMGVFYLVVDVWNKRFWCQPFVWMGMNSITIYLASNIIGGFRPLATRFVGGDIRIFFDTHIAKGFGDLVIAITGLLLAFAFVWYLHRKKLFLRL